MRKLIQKLQKPQFDFPATLLFLESCACFFGSDLIDHLFALFEEEKGIILGQAQLALNGGKIIQLTGAKGAMIGTIKEWLFHQVTEGFVVNNTDELIKHLQDNLNLFDL